VKRRELHWIDERAALAIHDRLISRYGGPQGVRDRGLLLSALARPRQHFAYTNKPDTLQMAALYTAGIVRNHTFVDGNKRTGFLAGILFLELNGFDFTATEEDATQAVIALAAGELTERSYAAWLQSNSKKRRARK
jgi:death on curing protein